MSLTAYEIAVDWEPDYQYVNEPRNTMEWYAWIIGVNNKYNLWMFQPAILSPTQDLVADILPVDYTVITINDDLQKYGYFRTFMLDQSVAQMEEFFVEEFDIIESLY
jgi:hypothetical protein